MTYVENPDLRSDFKRAKDFLLTGSYEKESVSERIKAGFRELEMNVLDRGEKSACLQMRKKFCSYSSGIQGGAALRKQIVLASSTEEFKELFAPYLD